MRILLVEDDQALGEGIRTALKPEGYTVDWLQDGASALHALSHESFELAILDLGLPRMDGLQLLKQLRAAANPVPVLVLTARDATGDRIAGLDAGADDYLVKPFDVAELKALVGHTFETPKPTGLVRRILGTMPADARVLDPFAGSGTTGHAVALANASDGGTRHCLSIDVPTPTRPGSKAAALGLATVAEITRTRLAAVAEQVGGGLALAQPND